jgi:hypothetical protein
MESGEHGSKEERQQGSMAARRKGSRGVWQQGGKAAGEYGNRGVWQQGSKVAGQGSKEAWNQWSMAARSKAEGKRDSRGARQL